MTWIRVALGQLQHLVDDLVDGLLFDLLAAYRAVGVPTRPRAGGDSS